RLSTSTLRMSCWSRRDVAGFFLRQACLLVIRFASGYSLYTPLCPSRGHSDEQLRYSSIARTVARLGPPWVINGHVRLREKSVCFTPESRHSRRRSAMSVKRQKRTFRKQRIQQSSALRTPYKFQHWRNRSSLHVSQRPVLLRFCPSAQNALPVCTRCAFVKPAGA